MSTIGRPRLVTDDALIEAGRTLTLPNVTVRAVAAELGVSEMSIYRKAGNLEGLRTLIAEGIIQQADFTLSCLPSPEEALVDLARRLRDYVLENPGIAEHLANLDQSAPLTLGRIDAAQRAFAEQYDLSPAHASVLVSTIAEHAVALAALNPRSHREHRDPQALEHSPTARAGAEATSALSPDERFTWSIRATARGALALLELHDAEN
ncbi:MAG: TetR/AcrR family transcriptional regulator [Microbacteriaceae bacterium]